MEPLWKDNDEADNDTQPFPLEDSTKGNKVVIKNLSNEKYMKVAIDATVAKQLLKEL